MDEVPSTARECAILAMKMDVVEAAELRQLLYTLRRSYLSVLSGLTSWMDYRFGRTSPEMGNALDELAVEIWERAQQRSEDIRGRNAPSQQPSNEDSSYILAARSNEHS